MSKHNTQYEPGTPPTGDYTLDLNGCARCGGDGHEELTFKPLTHPVDYQGLTASHWAPCPTNGEPILMTFQQPVPDE